MKTNNKGFAPIAIVLIVVAVLAIGGYIYSRNMSTAENSDSTEVTPRKDADATCASSKNPNRTYSANYETECGKFLTLWYSYHTNRLGISKSEVDAMTGLESFDVNTTATEGVAIYRVDYYVYYGQDISIKTHDAFPLSVPPNVNPPYPSINVPRDNSPLAIKDLKNIGTAWYSNLTSFPRGPLAYQTNKSLNDDIQNIYRNAKVDKGSVSKVTYGLTFKGDAPVATLSGEDMGRNNCYGGSHNLVTKVGEIHWSSPCRIN